MGKSPAPKHSIIIHQCKEDHTGLVLPNLEYDIWLVADQLLVGWLYNSMTPKVTAQVMGYDELSCCGMPSKSTSVFNQDPKRIIIVK